MLEERKLDDKTDAFHHESCACHTDPKESVKKYGEDGESDDQGVKVGRRTRP